MERETDLFAEFSLKRIDLQFVIAYASSYIE